MFILAVVLVSSVVSYAKPLTIVVTFPSLLNDVKLVVCDDDVVVSLVPPGVDPHEYQLKPRDVEVLAHADLIVSTGHTPFEARIEELHHEGVLRGELLVVWRVAGVELRRNPETGVVNLHMPIYDPRNYVAFIRALAEELERLRPECRSVYEARAEELIARVNSLYERYAGVLAGRSGVADLPFTQYAVEWLGLRIAKLVVKEPGVPPSPADLQAASRLLAQGAIAVVTYPPRHPASMKLLELAREYGAPVVYVPSPLNASSIPEKLEFVISGVERVLVERETRLQDYMLAEMFRWYVTVMLASIAFGALSVVVAARRLYFLAAGLPHASLLAATLAIPVARFVGIPEYVASALTAVAIVLVFDALVERGVDPDVAASVFVASTASASVAVMYYVLSHFPVQFELWAYILGDPLLISGEALIATLIASLITLVVVIATYREQVCLGVDPVSARLAGIRTTLYDTLFLTILASSTVILLRSIGFVIEHVMILLPGAIATTVARGMWRALATGVAAALVSGVLGLTLSIVTGVAPAAAIGAIAVALYAAALVARGR